MSEIVHIDMSQTAILDQATADGFAEQALAKFEPFRELIAHPPDQHAIITKLNEKIPKSDIAVRTGPGNVGVSYLTGHDAIWRANQVFTPMGWNTRIINVSTTSTVETEVVGKGTVKYFVSESRCHIRIDAINTSHEDVGWGYAKYKERKGCAENSEKEAVTDAIKRCLRQFGEYLGNCLYDKKYLTSINRIEVKKTK